MSLGFSDQNKTTNANSTTNTVSNPWGVTIPALTGLVNTAASTPTGVTPTQTSAFNTLLSNAAAGNPEAGAINADAANQLNVGNQAGTVATGLQNETNQLTPIANGSLTDIQNNPEIQGLLKTIQSQVTNSVDQNFAGAGRSNSGDNAEAIALGLSQGEAAPLLNEYNTLLGNQISASTALGSAHNAAAGATDSTLANQAAIQNAGVNTNQAGLAATNYAPTQALNVSEAQTALPFQNLGLLSSILGPIAGLGGTSTSNQNGTSVTNGTSFGGSADIAKLLLSDERAKTDKREVGELHDGTPIYSYRYTGDPVTRVGPMAQDVEERTPDAVSNDGPGGLKTVDMKKATDKAAAVARERASKMKSRKAA